MREDGKRVRPLGGGEGWRVEGIGDERLSAWQQLLQRKTCLGRQALRVEVAGDDLQGLFDTRDIQVAQEIADVFQVVELLAQPPTR